MRPGKRRLLEGKVLNSFAFTIKETVHISFSPSYLWYSDGGVVRNASLYLFGTYRASELDGNVNSVTTSICSPPRDQ